jgi:hypothetical protein
VQTAGARKKQVTRRAERMTEMLKRRSNIIKQKQDLQLAVGLQSTF